MSCQGESTGTVTLSAAAPVGGARVWLSHDYAYEFLEEGSDPNRPMIPEYVDVSAGETVATFPIFPYRPQCEGVFPVPCDEWVTITGILGGTKSADVYKPWVCSLFSLSVALDDTEIRSGGVIRGSVKLGSAAPRGGASIALQFGAESELVTVPEGQQTGRFALPSPRLRRRERMIVKAQYQGARGEAGIEVVPGGLSLVLPRTAFGGETIDGTVELMEPAPTGGTHVRLRSVDAAVDEIALVSDGQSSVTVRIVTPTVSEPREVTITASVDGVEVDARVLLEPATVSLVSCEITPSSVHPGSVVQGVLMLSAAAPAGGIVVRIHANGGALSLPDVVLVPEGALVTTFEFAVAEDARPGVVAITATLNGAPCTTELVVLGRRRAARPMSWLRRLFDKPATRSSLSLSIGARFTDPVTDTGGTELSRHSLYSPELQLLAETTISTGTTLAPIAFEYVWFGGQPLAQIETTTGAVHHYFNDHLGTPILTINSNSAVDWRVEREPYGKIYSVRVGANRYQPLSFPGQEEAGSSELSYNIFRWYRSGWGRYTQSDPYELAGGVNLFEYVNDHPLRFTDPLGLDTVGCDSFNWSLETPCQLECCATHDKCFDDNNCSSGSWPISKAKCGCDIGSGCQNCNSAAKSCLTLKCNKFADPSGTNDNPNQPNYYCGKLHKFICIPGDFSNRDTAEKTCEYDYSKDCKTPLPKKTKSQPWWKKIHA
jgi:RHS repeat-associated protein